MNNKRKVIITCAVTGGIHTPSMSPHLPITPEEIADSAIAAAESGAAIVHLHARDPETGKPTQDPDVFARILPRIKSESNAIINLTTGGSPHMSVEERMRPAIEFKPELASMNMGSMNFGLFSMLKRYKDFTHSWEKSHLENSRDLVFKNTFSDIEKAMVMGTQNGTRFECECYDIGHLYSLRYMMDHGYIEGKVFIQSVFGILGGIGTHAEDVAHMKRTANRLFGENYEWSVLGAGNSQMRIAAQSAAMGGHVRVGLEDSLWSSPGKLAESNASQVQKIRLILEELSFEIASPDEARTMLQLKGANNVGF